MAKNIIDFLNETSKRFYEEKIAIFDGLSFSQYDTIKRIEFYSNSKYTSGMKDQLGRDKPFFNIVNAKVNLAITATDLDTKDMQIISRNPTQFDKSFILRRENENWMKEDNFGLFLNELGSTRPKYGGVLVKKVMRDGKLHLEIPSWKNIINDQTNLKGVIIEKHFLTIDEYERMATNFNKDVPIEDIMKTSSDTIMGQKQGKSKTPTKYIIAYEVHGEFPETYIDQEGSKDKYVGQYHVIVGERGAKNRQYIVHSEIEKESPYKYLAWRSVPGRALGIGVVEEGFEAQMWTNDAKIKEKESMELGSKVIYWTSDTKLQNNILTDLDNGAIIKGQAGTQQPIQVNTLSNALPEYSKLAQQWDDQFAKTTSTFESNTGDNLPSGTPYRLAIVQSQNANSLFNYRRQELGIFLEEIFSDWVIPYLMKKINKEHILAADFSREELKMIDESFAVSEANKLFFDRVLDKRQVISQEDYDSAYQLALDYIKTTKGRRFIKIPKGYFDDMDAKVTILTTGEQLNKGVVLESLNNIMTTVAQNPGILENPTLSQIFARIVEIANVGISPFSLGIGIEKPKVQNQATGLSSGMQPNQPNKPTQSPQPNQTA